MEEGSKSSLASYACSRLVDYNVADQIHRVFRWNITSRSQFSALLDRTRRCPAFMPRPHSCKATACLLKLRARCIVADHGNCSLVGVGVMRSLEQQPKLRNLPGT